MIPEIARRVSVLGWNDLTAAAQERLLLCLLANISVGVAGVGHAFLPEPAVPGGRYRLLSGRRAPDARAAAFWNAAVMHARTQDDFHPVGNLHAGTVILPALLAVADERSVPGADFLAALAAGYMVAAALSRKFSPLTTPRGLRSTGIYAPFGASAAVARASGATAERIGHVLALTTAFAGGQTQTWVDGTHEWQVHVAHGADAALLTNMLAASGVRGGEHALDGPAGFFRAMVGSEISFQDIAEDFDNPSASIEETVIKRYPVSGICQSVVLAAVHAAARMTDASSVRAIRLVMNPFEMRYPGTLNEGPFKSFTDRLMSARFCAASTLAQGGFSFQDFQTASHPLRDRLVTLTTVSDDPALPLLSARIEIDTADGNRIEERIENARDEVAIDSETIDSWASDLWQSAGASVAAYRELRDAVRALPHAAETKLPLNLPANADGHWLSKASG